MLQPPKKSGKLRPLGLSTWSDKLVAEVVRLLLEAYYDVQFSDHSLGFRPRRGCYTALREVVNLWKGTHWFIEGDISDCFAALTTRSCCQSWRRGSAMAASCG
jgi:retron-type reverse transcriptase